jgi:hypothetical protein
MKRILTVFVILIAVAAVVPAQSIDFAAFQTDFENFADAVASTLASTATTGLNWSDAYIGVFPHLGIGLTVGASLIPYATVEPIFTLMAVSLPSELSFMTDYGVPIPAATLDARIGGFGLPFDIGLKFGFIPDQAKSLLGDIQLDYMMVGGDVRFAILQDKGFTPDLSVGVGYSYYKGSIGLAGLMDGADIDVSDLMNAYNSTTGQVYTLSMSSPDLDFNWESNVVEAKVQLSKKLLFITPSIGMSAAYGKSMAGGGVSSALTTSSNTTLAEVQQAFEALGYTAPTDQGILVSKSAEGWAFRAFGGLGIQILFLDIDVNASYNVLSGSLGGSANLRVQF